MIDGPTDLIIVEGFEDEDPADPSAMLRMIEYLIPEARQISPNLTFLLYLTKHELLVMMQENDPNSIVLRVN